MRNLHQLFILCTASQIIGGDFAKFCGLLRIYELYEKNNCKRIKLLIHKIFLTIVYRVSLLSFSGNDNGDGGLN